MLTATFSGDSMINKALKIELHDIGQTFQMLSIMWNVLSMFIFRKAKEETNFYSAFEVHRKETIYRPEKNPKKPGISTLNTTLFSEEKTRYKSYFSSDNQKNLFRVSVVLRHQSL
jgi:hypothetical protein